MAGKQYYVYIMTNVTHRVLYTGVTNNLLRRVDEHRRKAVKGFSAKYNVSKLVWYAATNDVHAAIAEEKRIKGGSRQKKQALIESMNPGWRDLGENL